MIVGIVSSVVSGLSSSLFYSKKRYIWFLLCLIFALCYFLGFTADITNILLFQVIMGVTTLGVLGIFACLVLLNKKGKKPRYNKTIFTITILALLFTVMGISPPKDFMLHTNEVIAKDKGNHTNSKYFEALTSKDNWDTENKTFSIDINSKDKVSLKLKGSRNCTVTVKNSSDFDKDTDQSVKTRKIGLHADETKTLSFAMKDSDYVEIELVMVDPDDKKTYVEFNNEMEDNSSGSDSDTDSDSDTNDSDDKDSDDDNTLGKQLIKRLVKEESNGFYYEDKADGGTRHFVDSDSKITTVEVVPRDGGNFVTVQGYLSERILHNEHLKYGNDKEDGNGTILDNDGKYNVYFPKNKEWYHISLQAGNGENIVFEFSAWSGKSLDAR